MMNESDDPALASLRPAVVIAHAADFYRLYPGERLTLFTRVEARERVAGFTVRIGLPEGLTLGATQASPNYDGSLPQLVFVEDARYLIWRLDREVQPGERYEYQLETTIAPTNVDGALTSRAVVTANAPAADPRAPAGGDGRVGQVMQQAETVTVAVSAKGRYLKYLPALYTDQDELMGRFVMLFESFWEPVEERIDNLHYYFDPRLTPRDLLPWLATWVDLVLDESWPDEKRRQLLSAMVPLYRQRGTRHGLQRYLEIYTGQQARIAEHRAHNFVLGSMARLGPSAALGKHNVSHTFEVVLPLPPVEDERQRKEQRRRIETIIESEKPAHTAYTLVIEETT